MSHAIKEHDKGAVGFTGKLGKTWHGIETYKHYDGAVNIEVAESVVNYDVIKIPNFVHVPQSNGLTIPKENKGSYALFRTDINEILYPAVGEQYEIISNLEMLGYLEGMFKDYGNLKIESIGTLNNGHTMFVNLNVVEHTVKGDISPSITRLMYTNSYGGASFTAAMHQTRIVCMNTLRVATAQGKANETLKRFRHTKNVSSKIQSYVVDLAGIVGEAREHNERLDFLASQPITPVYMDSFLENMFPSEGKQGASQSIAKNKQDAVKNLYESALDLKALPDTRYKLFNAVTDYTSHEMSINNGDDQAKRFMNVASAGTAGDKLNQQAIGLLSLA